MSSCELAGGFVCDETHQGKAKPAPASDARALFVRTLKLTTLVLAIGTNSSITAPSTTLATPAL